MTDFKFFYRCSAWILALITAFVILFSATYISEHSNHDCLGDECPICAMLEQCSENVKTACLIAIASFVFAYFLISVCESAQYSVEVLLCNSLFSQKIRFNN